MFGCDSDDAMDENVVDKLLCDVFLVGKVSIKDVECSVRLMRRI